MDPRDFTAAEQAADTRRPAVPVVAFNDGGDVVLMLDPATARTVAVAWSILHTTDETHNRVRPRWHDDLVSILSAAAYADLEAGTASIDHGTYAITPVPPSLTTVNEPVAEGERALLDGQAVDRGH